MKYTFITISLATLFCTTTANAQLGPAKKILPVVTLGVKAGVNMQQTKGTSLDGAYSTGFLGGIFAGVAKKKMGIRVEGLVKSAKIEFNPVTSVVTGTTTPPAIKTVAVDIPLLFEYSVIKRLKLHAGPQFTTILSANQGGADVKGTLKSSEISAVVGAEVHLPLKLTVGARYIMGLTDISTASTNKTTTSTIQLSVGYRFLN